MKTFTVLALLVVLAWLVGPRVLEAYEQQQTQRKFNQTKEIVRQSVYGGRVGAPDFTPENPLHAIEQRDDGTFRFAGTAFVPSPKGIYVDQWEAIYDPKTGAVRQARSLGSTDPAAPPAARPKTAPTPKPPGAWMWEPGRTKLDSRKPTGQVAPRPRVTGYTYQYDPSLGRYVPVPEGSSYLRSVGGGGY